VSTDGFGLDRRAAYLRAAFDCAFAKPPPEAVAAKEDFLAIQVAGDPYALRVSELAGLVVDRKVAPLPSARTALSGVAGIRGALVPIYSLSSLLGYDARATPTRWLALCGRAEALGLAFDHLEGFLRIAQEDLYQASHVDASRPHLAEVVRIGTTTRRVVSTRSIMLALDIDAGASGATKEG
jgi:chemotaxis signal transduction protein